MAEWDALDLFMQRVMESDYKLTNAERDSLYFCESEVFWRSGTGVVLSTAALLHTNPRSVYSPIGALVTAVGGMMAGRAAAEPCLRQVLSLKQSLLALEAKQCLVHYAPERCGSRRQPRFADQVE